MNANEDPKADDAGDPVMEWALAERLGGERPPDLVAAVRARLAVGEVPVAESGAFRERSLPSQLLVAAMVLLGVFVVVAVAVWPRGGDATDVAVRTAPQGRELARVYSQTDAEALPATTRGVEVFDADDTTIHALTRLRDLEELVVREPFHENHGLGLKRTPPTAPKHVTAAAWADLLSFSKLQRLELSGTLLAGRVRAEQIADGLERLPLLSTLALRYLDTDTSLLAVLPRIRGLQCLDLSFNHGFDEGWIDAVLQCRSLRVLTVTGCQQVHGRELARLGELPLLEQLDAGGIDGINWRNSASFLDDTEREVLARAQRRADRLGMGPTDEALAGIAKCAKLRVLDVSGGNWTATGLAELGACTDLKVLNAFGGNNKDAAFVAALPAGLERLEVCGDYTDAFCTAVADNLKHLRHLVIAACYQITDRGLAKVAAMPSLRVLDMRQMRGLTVATIDTLLAATQLEDLDVRHCDFVTAQHVVQLRRSLPRLQQLETSVDPKQIEAAERLSDAGAQVRTKAQIEALAAAAPSVRRCIEGVDLDDECVAALAKLKGVEEIVLRPDRAKERALMPAPPPVTDAGIRELVKIPTLRVLHLDRCRQVSDDGLVLLAQLPVLEELRFAVMSVPDAFFARLEGTPLKRLTLQGCRGFGRAGLESIARIRGLRELSLQGCVHLDEDWIAGLAVLPQLEKLDLSYIGSHTMWGGLSEFGSHVTPGSGVSSSAITALAKLSTLRELSLAYGAVDAPALRSLQDVPQLASLDLMGTDVTTADLEALPPSLTTLVLDNCRKLGQDFGATLARATPKLHTLGVCYSPQLRDECLRPLAALRALRKLDVSHCKALTADAVDGLVAIAQLEHLVAKGLAAFGTEQWAKLRAMPDLKVLETGDEREVLRK